MSDHQLLRPRTHPLPAFVIELSKTQEAANATKKSVCCPSMPATLPGWQTAVTTRTCLRETIRKHKCPMIGHCLYSCEGEKERMKRQTSFRSIEPGPRDWQAISTKPLLWTKVCLLNYQRSICQPHTDSHPKFCGV